MKKTVVDVKTGAVKTVRLSPEEEVTVKEEWVWNSLASQKARERRDKIAWMHQLRSAILDSMAAQETPSSTQVAEFKALKVELGHLVSTSSE